MTNCRRILHIDMDAFFVSVEQQHHPELKGKPVVVGGRPDRRGVVAAASYEARKFGLHSGMPLSTARRLCPQAIFIEGSFELYHEASQKFMAILADSAPDLEPMGLDEAYLDVTGFESLYGSLVEMGQHIRQRIKKEIGITASVGIASSKVVAKVASEAAKPDSLVEVPAGEEAVFLKSLPVEKLPGIGDKTAATLKNIGIDTVGRLALVPPEALKSRFGVYGEMLWRFSRGIDNRKVLPPAEARSISRSTTFKRDTRQRPFLEATLRHLSDRVGYSLRNRNHQSRCIVLKVRFADFTTITRRTTLKQPTDAGQVIFKIGLELLKIEIARERQPLRLIGIGVTGLSEMGRQLDMPDNTAARQLTLNKAVDKIRKKYGFPAIQTGRTLLLKDIFPEDEGGYRLHTPSLSR